MSSVPDTSAPTTLPASASRLLAGKVAFVTGGARGIGAAIVQRLARDGAAVAFTYSSSEAPAQALVASIEAGGGKALALRADSADAAALTQAIDTAARTLGRLDILVNNAGVAVAGEIDSFALADFDHTLNVNVRAVFVATQAAVRHGPVNTDWTPADGPLASNMHGMMALGRHAHPDEIAGMVAYLAGPESGMVTGASLLIDGGFAA